MTSNEQIKTIIDKYGADLFGIASIDRFINAPAGFNPKDIYSKTKSVIVFAKRIPNENLYTESVIPFTHINSVAEHIIDNMSYNISCDLESIGIKSVIIPTDDPYEYWDEEQKTGRAILSLRHAAYLAGLGVLARNNLLVNDKYGNMIQIGALLTDLELEQSAIADYKCCPDKCRICIDTCPVNALDGITVNQKLCRPLSTYKTSKGYVIKKCYNCRKNCPVSTGIKTKNCR